MFQYFMGVAMVCGHDPRDVVDYPWRDLRTMTAIWHSWGFR